MVQLWFTYISAQPWHAIVFAGVCGATGVTALKSEITKSLLLPASFSAEEIKEHMFFGLLMLSIMKQLAGGSGLNVGEGEPRNYVGVVHWCGLGLGYTTPHAQ